MIRRTLPMVVAVAWLLALGACTDDSGDDGSTFTTLACPTVTGGPLTLVVGARSNSPKPDLPSEIRSLVRQAAEANQRIQIIRLDGQPSVALNATFHTNEKNEKRNERNLENFVKQTLGVVQNLKPKVAEADGLAALAEAARITPEGGTVVFIDSGLATAGPLSYKNVEMFSAEPGDVSQFLKAQELMPNLSNRAVVLVGLGNTADPQPELSEKLRGRVDNIWQTIAKDAGATCVGELAIASRRGAADYPVPVSVVALPKPVQFAPCGTTVLADSNAVGFIVDTPRLREPEDARKVLRQLADQLKNGSQRVLLVGNTSSEGQAARNVTLSKQRADAIKTELVRLGVDASRITTRGDGSTGKYHKNDRTGKGALIPSVAAGNRSVVVELICPRS